MDDARLCLANILQAVSFGAVCGNYVRLRQLLTVEGRVCGALAEDAFTGRQLEIHAQAVVNATGPWSDGIRRLSDTGAPARLAPTKGIHLVLPHLTEDGLFVQARRDGRMVFILPWGDYTLAGTTETKIREPLEALEATPEEIGYLLDEVNRVLPGRGLNDEDIIATYAGARPLLAFTGSAIQASREHRLEVDRRGLVSVLGGKYTTYRVMAQQAVDFIVSRHGWTVDRSLADRVSLIEGVHRVALDHWRDLIATLNPEVITRLLIRYGTGTLRLFELLEHDPSLAQPVCPHHAYLEAELVYSLQRELACTVTDVLARRTRIAWSSCQGLDFLSRVVDLWQRYGHLSAQSVHQQREAYQQFLARSAAVRPAPPVTHSVVERHP
jgi:glycerol-3-phosphate dehydrogenase